MQKLIGVFFLLLVSYTNLLAHNNNDSAYNQNPAILETSTGKIYGTITLPNYLKKGKIVLIISGSGPTDRDGNNSMMKNNSLKQFAFALADSGIASLRFDKRGIAASAKAMSKESDIRFDDLVNDVKSWILYLKKDKRFTEIIVAGHSEGSLLGMIASTKNVNKYISISGPGNPADVIIKTQLGNQSIELKKIAEPMLDSLSKGFQVHNNNLMLASFFRPSVQPYLISWFKYNPQNEIKKIKIPVLIIQGDKDIQLSIEDAKLLFLAKGSCQLAIIKNMNHVLKIIGDDKDENIKSYSNPSLPISSDFITKVVSFIK
jgi:pimeloyl-ACP methyl ester carboxylesterase